MKTYDEIKDELIAIADVLKKYPENMQLQVFDLLTSYFLGGQKIVKPEDNQLIDKPSSKTKPKSSSSSKGNVKTGKKSSDTLIILKELDLRAKGKKSFSEFFEEKRPSASNEFNSVAVYYLAEILELTGITPNHVYTCYKEATQRLPVAFVQSLRDTAIKNGYIDTADINNIKISIRGKNFVEHDLPKKKTKK